MQDIYFILANIIGKNISLKDLEESNRKFVKRWYPTCKQNAKIKAFNRKLKEWKDKTPTSIRRPSMYEVALLLNLSVLQCNQLMAQTGHMVLSPRNIEDAFLIFCLERQFTLDELLDKLSTLLSNNEIYTLFSEKHMLKDLDYKNTDDTNIIRSIPNSYTTKKMYTQLKTIASFEQYISVYERNLDILIIQRVNI